MTTELNAAWNCVLELRPDRSIAAGSFSALCDAVRRAADLRIYTEFLFEEHIVPGGDGHPDHSGLIREVIDFRETILVDDRHAAGITTFRQPLHPPFGFNGTQPKMSYFLYNMDGQQACANVLLDSTQSQVQPGERREIPSPVEMPKMSRETVWDQGTCGPSRNFIYDMEVYRFIVRDDWEEILAHDETGRVSHGSFDALEQAQIGGREIKVGLRNLCAELGVNSGTGVDHEVFSLLGSGFLHTKLRVYNALTHPLVRIAAAIPLHYQSRNWDVSWVYLGTDGQACLRSLDPYSRRFTDRPTRFACRWFAR